jgi:DNA-binding YbaB/EbfC family protein
MNKNMLKQAQQLQQKLLEEQQKLESESVIGTSGGGAIQITVNGKYQVTEVKIDPEAIDAENVEMLEDLITAGFNEAIEKIQQLSSSRLSSLTGGFKLPGIS